MPDKTVLVLLLVAAAVAAYIGGGILLYRNPNMTNVNNNGRPSVYEGLQDTAKNATIEGRAEVEGVPGSVELGHHVYPVVNGMIVIPKHGLWEDDVRACHRQVVDMVLRAQWVEVEGDKATWYIHGYGWEKVLLADHIELVINGVEHELEYTGEHCHGMNHHFEGDE